ncbi:MAG TPA: hypothetical protein VGD09_08965 [Blastococcus sp.]
MRVAAASAACPGWLPSAPAYENAFPDRPSDVRASDADRVELHLSTVFGDVEVIVSEGVDAELDGWTLVGDRTTELAPVPRLARTPRVVVHARTVFGDLRLRSLAPGNSPSRSLRRRCDSAALTLPF